MRSSGCGALLHAACALALPIGGCPSEPAPSALPLCPQYHQRLCEYLDTYDKAFVVGADNVGSKQFSDIRAVSAAALGAGGVCMHPPMVTAARQSVDRGCWAVPPVAGPSRALQGRRDMGGDCAAWARRRAIWLRSAGTQAGVQQGQCC